METLHSLQQEGELILYTQKHVIGKEEEKTVIEFLCEQFEEEMLDYALENCQFNAKAALWAAETVYKVAHFILFTTDTLKDLKKLQPYAWASNDLSACLSADLCLRYLPSIIEQLHSVDPDDPLIVKLHEFLSANHFSGIGYKVALDAVNWEKEFVNKDYQKIYLDRIVERKDYILAEIPYINKILMASFGLYHNQYWKELRNIEKLSYE